MNQKVRPIAIHLPQFHPIAENDKWWGKGFSEWRNVTKTKPLYKGHYQPHLPADLGFYDLRLEASRVAQAELARQYGIYGFCFYHYWFNGKRLLEQPLDDMLKSRTPDFPFMLCWANENWTRRWDGAEHEVLMQQNYSLADHAAHAEFLCSSFFKDPRYITVDGKPFFVFYKASLIPELAAAIVTWRNVAKKHGFSDLYLTCMDNFVSEPAESYGFDSAIHFHPDYRYFNRKGPTVYERLLKKTGLKESLSYQHHIENYADYFDNVFSNNHLKSQFTFPGITPMWDNSARKKTGSFILDNSTPDTYFHYLEKMLKAYQPKSDGENFFFINAWNEWAEGNHLEPCLKWGLQYLEKTKEAFDAVNKTP